jgi:hypothetical protein
VFAQHFFRGEFLALDMSVDTVSESRDELADFCASNNNCAARNKCGHRAYFTFLRECKDQFAIMRAISAQNADWVLRKNARVLRDNLQNAHCGLRIINNEHS